MVRAAADRSRGAADHRRADLLVAVLPLVLHLLRACRGDLRRVLDDLVPHPWAHWSILGTALILFVTYFQVQVSVAINDWYGPFYDLIQAALAKTRPVEIAEFYGSC